MKRLTILTLVFCIPMICFSAQKKNGREAKEFFLKNGIPLYYMENTNNKVDAVYIWVRGGTDYLTKEESGLEEVLFSLMSSGSKNYSKSELQSINYRTGISLSSSSSVSGSLLQLSCISDYLDTALPVLTDGFLNPLFLQSEYDRLMTEYENSVQQLLNNPESLGIYFLEKIIYEGHPFEVSASVTPDSIQNISLEKVLSLYNKILDARRISIIAVTRKPAEKLMEYFNKELGNIAKQDYELIKKEVPQVTVKQEPMVIPHEFAEGTGFVYRAFADAPVNSEDYIPAVIAESIYSKTMHNVIRAKYGSCYSAYSGNFGSIANVGLEVIYRCSDFSHIKEQMAEARQIMADGKFIASTNDDGSFVLVPIADLIENFKNETLNSTYSSQATTAGLASRIRSSLVLFGDTTSLSKRAEEIRSVTEEKIMAAFKKYVLSENEFYLAVCGPSDEKRVEALLLE